MCRISAVCACETKNALLECLLNSLLVVPSALASSGICRAVVESESLYLDTAAGAWLRPEPQCKQTK